MRQFTDNIPGILGEHYYQCCSRHPTHSRQRYRDYIIDLYGVKDSTTSYSKCAMPSLSCLLSFYTIPISLFFNPKNILFSSTSRVSCYMQKYLPFIMYYGSEFLLFTNILTGGCTSHYGIRPVYEVSDLNS